jgi:hypothetical protein
MSAASSKTVVPTCKTSRRHSPYDQNQHLWQPREPQASDRETIKKMNYGKLTKKESVLRPQKVANFQVMQLRRVFHFNTSSRCYTVKCSCWNRNFKPMLVPSD